MVHNNLTANQASVRARNPSTRIYPFGTDSNTIVMAISAIHWQPFPIYYVELNKILSKTAHIAYSISEVNHLPVHLPFV